MSKQDLAHGVFFFSFIILIGILIFGSIRVNQVNDDCYVHILKSISTDDIVVSKYEFNIAYTYLEKLGINKAEPDSDIGIWFSDLGYYQHRLDYLTKHPDFEAYQDLLDDMRSSLYAVNSDRNSSDILHPILITVYPYAVAFNLLLFSSIIGLFAGGFAFSVYMKKA